MSPKSTLLRDAIVLAIALNAGAALAQTADEARTLDAITVTGSRIAIPGVEASSPVAAVERDEFLTTQPVAVEAFLKEFPALTPSIGQASNYEPGGAATINMRGLGDNRTLVLVDGRRPVPYNLANVVDTNTIPMALLQSVEMLTGGASVVYGADAVAGVTNFILRRDFEGVEVNSNWGEASKGDGTRQNYEITFGALSDDGRANAVLSVGFSKAAPVRQGDRPWSVVSLDSLDGSEGGSGSTVPARINVIGAGQDVRQIDPATGELVPTYYWYNFNPLNYFQTGLDRWQATGLARYEFNRHAEAYGQVNYTRSQVGAAQAPTAIFLQVLDVPLANPYIPLAMKQQICNEHGFTATECASGRIDPGSRYDPDYISVDANGNLVPKLGIGRRLTELGPRLNDYDTKTFQSTVGLRGDLGGSWRYDGYWSYGESDQLQRVGNWGSLAKVRQAMNAISETECIDPSNGCVPLNPFGAEGTINQAMLDFINLSAFSMQKVEQTNAAFNLNGDLGEFKSPWADYPIGVSAGVEYRRTVAGIQSDAAYSSGDVMGLDAATPDSRGGFSIKEAYLESIIPLVNGRAGVENLSLELGYRHSDFSNTGGFGDDYGSWKYGLSWSPVEQLKFRAMRQRATRAPNVGELFAPGRLGVDNLTVDPCQGNFINAADAGNQGTLSWLCAQTGVPASAIGNLPRPSAGQVTVWLEGNPALSPEKADTTTLGLVWTPSDHLSVTLDWWDIEINDAISTPLVQDIIGGCYGTVLNPGRDPNHEMCQLIDRNTLTGSIGGGGTGARGAILPLSNQGFVQKTGIDLGVRLAHDLPGTLGGMQYALDLSKVTRDDFQAAPISIVRDCLGYYSTSCTPSHELRSNLRAIWNVQDVSVTLAWRYFSAIDIEPLAEADGPYFAPYRHIPSYSYFDLGVSYNTPWNGKLSLSVNNVFDKTPPVVGNEIGSSYENAGNTFPQWYDALGRYFSFGVSFRF